MNKVETLGPAPTPEPPQANGPRGLILDHLRQAAAPLTVQQLAAAGNIHSNTVRAALAELGEADQVSREQLPTTGRGRPTYGYSITLSGRNSAPARPAFREYRGLTEAFAAHLARGTEDPSTAARDIGRTWGASLAAEAPSQAGEQSAQARVVTLLGELGFSPTRDAEDLALRTCPLLDLAREMPEVICQVHQGLLEGALEHYDDHGSRADLRPFAEVGACRLGFEPRTSASDPAAPSTHPGHRDSEAPQSLEGATSTQAHSAGGTSARDHSSTQASDSQ